MIFLILGEDFVKGKFKFLLNNLIWKVVCKQLSKLIVKLWLDFIGILLVFILNILSFCF